MNLISTLAAFAVAVARAVAAEVVAGIVGVTVDPVVATAAVTRLVYVLTNGPPVALMIFVDRYTLGPLGPVIRTDVFAGNGAVVAFKKIGREVEERAAEELVKEVCCEGFWGWPSVS